MSPEPDREHQDFEGCLETWLRLNWARPRRPKVYHRINLALPGAGDEWIHNFRIPDLVLLTPARFSIDRKTHFEGGPEVAVEIRSPGDESEDKLPFYAQLGILEVWIIDRDTKEVDLYSLVDDEYVRQASAESGWFQSECTGLEMRAGRPGKFAIRISGDNSTCEELPED